jgi:hypothetical protein
MSVNATPSALPEYLLLLRGTQLDQRLPLHEMQEAMGKFTEWVSSLALAGKLKLAQPLGHDGKIVGGQKERTVSDGPFAESKEAVGGYLLLTVDTIEEAIGIAKECPLIDWGSSVEVRPVIQECPTMQIVGKRLADAAALSQVS